MLTAWSTPASGLQRGTNRLISSLLADHPGAGAGPDELAAWLDRKAEVFDTIAAVRDGQGDVVGAGEARATATQARTDLTRATGQATTTDLTATSAEAPVSLAQAETIAASVSVADDELVWA